MSNGLFYLAGFGPFLIDELIENEAAFILKKATINIFSKIDEPWPGSSAS